VDGTPGFGGTNGVTELDLGQPGSARRTAKKAHYTVERVVLGPTRTGTVLHKVTGQDMTFAENLGFAGQDVSWQGTLRIKDDTELAALRSHIQEYLTGQTIDADGKRSAKDVTKVAPTTLTDSGGKAISDKAKMIDPVSWGPKTAISTNADYAYLCTLEIRFSVLG
jgi:hypothetical protein